MADLLTLQTLAVWTQNEPNDVAADPYATEVVDKVSRLAQFLGGHPLWTLTPGADRVPFDVEMVVLQVAKRTYANPDQEKSSTVGPINSSVLDVAALLTELTDSERRTLTKYNPDGDPNLAGVGGGLWVQPVSPDPASLLPNPVLFVDDDQQINMTPDQSAYPSWSIPLFSPDDPGDPNNYDQEI